jgi:hypothetical protein
MGFGRVSVSIIGLCVVAVLGAGSCESDSWVAVASRSELREKRVIYDPELNVFVLWSSPTPFAQAGWSPRGPDRHDRVLYCRSSEMFVSAFGELFDRMGNYYGGPAPRGLDRVAVRLYGDRVLVDPTIVSPGPARGDPKALEPAGPFCAEDAAEVEPGFLPNPE